jgi:hypothetical protein
MAADSGSSNSTIDEQIAYHKQKEHIANIAGDFTKAEHHRNMCDILEAMKQRQQPQSKTPEQIEDEDYKVAPTSADKQNMSE